VTDYGVIIGDKNTNVFGHQFLRLSAVIPHFRSPSPELRC
jgi:hypothetical protein